jgi:hypothetical protein
MERKHSYYKPKYKKLLRLKENVYNTDKFFKLKKKKWQILVSVLAKKKKKNFGIKLFIINLDLVVFLTKNISLI